MSAQKCDTMCLPRELVQEILVREIGSLLSAQSTLLYSWLTEEDFGALQDEIAENGEFITLLLAYFPSREEREDIIFTVLEKTGFEIDENFFVGVSTYMSEMIGRSPLDS